MMLIYVTILINLMLFFKQAHGRPTWSSRATWCPRAPCWRPLVCNQSHIYSAKLKILLWTYILRFHAILSVEKL